MPFSIDHLIVRPSDIDLDRSPLAGRIDAPTFVLGAFNPGLARLPSGNLLMMIRVAEALRDPVAGRHVHALRWTDEGYRRDAWPLAEVDMTDPRAFRLKGEDRAVLALTSLSWLLPIELDSRGATIVAWHYDKAIAPHADFQCYGIEDARISHVDGRWLMTACSVSPERQGTSLYVSDNGLDWRFVDLVLDHQNKDMLIFSGRIDGHYWAQTRPLGDAWFAYPPDSRWRAGPAINLATSPDLIHWKPCQRPGIRPRRGAVSSERMGGGAPPILTSDGWLSLWHGVEPGGTVGIYRTFWSLLDRDDPSIILREGLGPLIEAAPQLTEALGDALYLDNVVFTTGIVDAGDHYIVASGEADIACRITHVPKSAFA